MSVLCFFQSRACLIRPAQRSCSGTRRGASSPSDTLSAWRRSESLSTLSHRQSTSCVRCFTEILRILSFTPSLFYIDIIYAGSSVVKSVKFDIRSMTARISGYQKLPIGHFFYYHLHTSEMFIIPTSGYTRLLLFLSL